MFVDSLERSTSYSFHKPKIFPELFSIGSGTLWQAGNAANVSEKEEKKVKRSIFCQEGKVIIGPVEFGLDSDLVVCLIYSGHICIMIMPHFALILKKTPFKCMVNAVFCLRHWIGPCYNWKMKQYRC